MSTTPPPKKGYGEIDESLRRAFDQVVGEGVPDRFADLLKRLKEGDIPPSSGEGSDK